jgi:hypothetical protein
MKNSITEERLNHRGTAIKQVRVERQRYPDRYDFTDTPEEFVDAILEGTTKVVPGDANPNRYKPLRRKTALPKRMKRRLAVPEIGVQYSAQDTLQNCIIRRLRRFKLATIRVLADCAAMRGEPCKTHIKNRGKGARDALLRRFWSECELFWRNQHIPTILDAKSPPWFTAPPLTLPLSCTTGTRVYSGDLAIRTASQINEDSGACSRCRKTILDLDQDWRTYASWVEPDRSQDEKYKNKSKFTSRRYCSSCHQKWIGSHKVRTLNQGTVVGIKRLYLPHQAMMSAILSKLPSGCGGAVLRHIILARPPVMQTSDLINQVVLAKRYQREVVRKTVRQLVVRDGLLDESRGQDGIDIPVVVLSQKAVHDFRVETDCGGGKTAIFRLDLYQPSARKKTPDTLDAAFRDRKTKWVVGCTIVGDDEKEEVDSKSVDKAFAMVDMARGNPYRDPDPDDAYDPDPAYEDPDLNEDPVDREHHFRSTIQPGDVLFWTEEEFVETGKRFTTRLIGTTSHSANIWHPELESVPPAVACNVCGYGHKEGLREFLDTEACLGCLRSGSDDISVVRRVERSERRTANVLIRGELVLLTKGKCGRWGIVSASATGIEAA